MKPVSAISSHVGSIRLHYLPLTNHSVMRHGGVSDPSLLLLFLILFLLQFLLIYLLICLFIHLTWCWSSGRTSGGLPPALVTWISGRADFGDWTLIFCNWWCNWSCSVSALRLWFCCRKSNAASVFFRNIFSCCCCCCCCYISTWTRDTKIEMIEWVHHSLESRLISINRTWGSQQTCLDAIW